jgi:hypothetical protein
MNWNMGKSVVVAFVAFAIFIGYMVVKSFGERTDLISDQYYEKELRHQETIDKTVNVRNLGTRFVITEEKEGLRILFPSTLSAGTISLLKPDNQTLDKEFAVHTDDSGVQHIPYAGLKSGKYIMQLDWSDEKNAYYHSTAFFVP